MSSDSDTTLISRGRLLRLLAAFAVFVALGVAFNYMYYRFSDHELDVKHFSNTLHEREAYADAELKKIRTRVNQNGLWNVAHDPHIYDESEKTNVAFFIFDKADPVFWSSNAIDVRSGGEVPYQKVFYLITRNSFCIGTQCADSRYRYVALIKVKRKIYPRRDSPQNTFMPGFDMPDYVSIVERSEPGSIPVSSINGTYLFSLRNTAVSNPSPVLRYACMASMLVAFVLMVLMVSRLVSFVRRGAVSWPVVAALLFVFLAVLFLMSYFQWPEILFDSGFFSPIYYASDFAPSLGHLVLFTLFVGAYFFVILGMHIPLNVRLDTSGRRMFFLVVSQLLSLVFFLGVYYLSLNLIYNSSMDVAVSYIQEISSVTVTSIFLLLSWFSLFLYVTWMLVTHFQQNVSLLSILLSRGVLLLLLAVLVPLIGSSSDWVGLASYGIITVFIDVFCHFFKRRHLSLVSILAFLSINSVVSICYVHCEVRNSDRYQMLAENMTDGQSMQQDAMAESLMESNSRLIMFDTQLHQLVITDTTPQRVANVEKYLVDKYFDGFWDKYEVDVQILPPGHPFRVRKSAFGASQFFYPGFIESECIRISQSSFYLNSRNDIPLSYIGVFELPHSEVLYILFYPNLSYNRTYSPEPTRHGRVMDVAMAKYNEGQLIYLSGEFHYPSTSTWIPNVRKRKFHFYSGDYVHFVSRFAGSNGYVVVSKQEHRSYSYFIFLSYLCALYVIVALSVMAILRFGKRKREQTHSIITRLQLWLLIPLLFCFLVTGSLSVWFFTSQFEKRQIEDLGFRAASIQQNLQMQVGEASTLASVNQTALSQQLKELSNLFHTDIILYDDFGGQVTSSRSTYLSERRRTSRLMNPVPKFNSSSSDYFRQEHRMGVDVLSFYTRLYNRRNQPVGYVNILSSSGAQQMRNEIFNLLVIIIDIYLVIVLLSVVVTWLTGSRLAKPISLLALKFREVKLTGTNAKIEYPDNDELGALVAQYNVMVDQLQQSAEKLAKSQRELAWRDMARRIAHEIKNPLTPMKLSVQLALRKKQLDPEHFDEYFQKTARLLIEQIDNLSRIASEFSTFAKNTITVREEVNLAEKVVSVESLFENNPEGVQFSLNMHGIEEAKVWTDGKQILQVFNNLFRNAIQAIPEGQEGKVEVDFSVVDENVLLRIRDNGCGIPEENRESIFQPNFTTKTSGMGLGLSIVKTIINQSGGDIWLESEVGVGTTFFIRIPLVKPGETS